MPHVLIQHLVLCLTFLVGLSSRAQQLSVDLGVGYGAGLTSIYQTTGSTKTDAVSGETIYDYTSNRFDYNQGLTAHCKVNYMLDHELFLVAGARYQNGSRKYDLYGYANSPISFREDTWSYEYEQLDVQIGLGIEQKLSERVSVYLSHGFTFFVYGKATTDLLRHTYYTSLPTSEFESTTLYKPAFTFGAYGDIGVLYKLTRHVSLFFNATIQSKNWSSKTSRITRQIYNGTDQIPGSSVMSLEAEYSDHIETNSMLSTDPDQPSVQLKTWMPNSGIEAVLGARITFGKDSSARKPTVSNTRLYVQGAFAYGMPMSERTMVSKESTSETIFVNSTLSADSKLYSYGKGLAGELLLGYSLGKGFSAEIGGVYNASKYSNSSRHSASNFTFVYSTTDTNTLHTAWMLRSTFGVKLESQKQVINAFVRTGFSLGFAALRETIETESSFSNPNPVNTTTKKEIRYSGNASFGAYIGLGASVRLSPRLALVSEAITYIQNWSPKRSEITEYTINGVDQLPNTSTYLTQTEYVSTLDAYSAGSDPNVPRKSLRTAEPFSSFMITLGLRYSIVLHKVRHKASLDE